MTSKLFLESHKSKEYREKLRKIMTGRKITWGDKISLGKKGKPSPRKGVKLSKEAKEKIRQAVLKQFKNGMPQATKDKISNTLKGRKFSE